MAAVTAAMNEPGTVAGTVTDQTTGLPIAAATVANLGGLNTVQTDADGHFSLTMLAGPVDFLVTGYGYFDGNFSVTITPGEQITQDVILEAKPTATISGHVYGPAEQAVPGATVKPLGVPVDQVVSDPTGYYELTLPRGSDLIYELRVGASGLGFQHQSVALPEDQTLDFHLPELFAEDFESGDFLTYPWTGGGNSNWIIDPDNQFEGAFSARSGDVVNGQDSILALDFFVSADSYLQFWSKVSSEFFYDGLQFFLDDVLVAFWTGEEDWSQFRLLIPRGHHEFRWVYHKDVAYTEGQDTAWLDFVEFPSTGQEQVPEISLDELALNATVAAGDTTSAPFTIANTGDWVLDFSLTVGDPLQADGLGVGDRTILIDPPAGLATVSPDQGQVAPGFGNPITVTFYATDLDPGIHVAVMTVVSTDPVDPEILVPLVLTVTEPSWAPDPELPRVVTFTGPVPNPFNPATSLHFSLPAAAEVALDIFDVSGRRVRSLVAGSLPAGPHVVSWNGRDETNRNVASGHYFARLTVEGSARVKSLTLVR